MRPIREIFGGKPRVVETRDVDVPLTPAPDTIPEPLPAVPDAPPIDPVQVFIDSPAAPDPEAVPADAGTPEQVVKELETMAESKAKGPEPDDDDAPDDEEEDKKRPSGPPDGLWQEKMAEVDARLAQVAAMQAAVEAKNRELDAALAAAKTMPPPAPTPPVPAAPAPPHREPVPDRYKGLDPGDMHKLTVDESADIEARLARGELPSEISEAMGLPRNRFVYDQIKKLSMSAQNRGLAGPVGPRAPEGGLAGGAKELVETMTALSKAGLIVTPKEQQEAMNALRLELGRGGGSDEAPYLSDPDSAATVEVAHTLKEVGMELVDAFREVTGHPRLKGAFHELRGTTGTTRTRTPILPKGVPEGSPAPPALPAAAPVPEAPGEGSIFKDHPEAGDALERILELAPVIYRFTTQRGKMPTEQLLGYVEKDAAAKARGAWLIASDKLPLHDWDATSMSCSRCKAPKNEENLYADCPKGTTQKDMLRRLGGKTVENLIELLGKYSQSVELTKPVDALGGMSLNKFFMERKWERGNLTLDLGGMTIYHCVLQTDEGLHWVGRFLTEITALVETESRPGVP